MHRSTSTQGNGTNEVWYTIPGISISLATNVYQERAGMYPWYIRTYTRKRRQKKAKNEINTKQKKRKEKQHETQKPTCKGVFGTVPVFSVPVWMSYRTYRSVRYRYWCRTELTEVSGTGIDVVPKLPKYPVPVWKSVPVPVLTPYRTYRSIWYR